METIARPRRNEKDRAGDRASRPAGPRLDYVSPLPPVRSGIADYSADLLEHLEPLCDLRVVALAGQQVAPELVERWRPVPATACGDDGRLPLYQMGNNPHHEAVLELAMARPGVLTLHDLVLHHLLVEATIARGRDEHMDEYRRWLARDHGWVGDETGAARYWTELGEAAMFTLAAHRSLLRRQRGVLVHNRWAAARVVEESGELAIRVVPMGVPLPPRPDPAARAGFRRRLGVGENTPLLGSFGFQTPIKRTRVAVRALAREPLAGAHLVVAGEVLPILDLAGEAAAAGVADRLHVTGFLEPADFQAAIAACDLCLNLRYPTAGETSASLLRVLALGRPAVVSDYAQFAELPDSATVKVPLGEEEEKKLAEAVGELLSDPQRLAEMGESAREMVRERHDPETAAGEIARALAELAQNEPPEERPLEVPPPTTLLWQELPGELRVTGADEPWGAGDRRELAIELTNTGVATWLPTKEQPGGVILDVQWRTGIKEEPIDRTWAELPTPLRSGATRRFELELRRPRGARYLVIEPHIENLAGMSRFGGPSWVGEYQS